MMKKMNKKDDKLVLFDSYRRKRYYVTFVKYNDDGTFDLRFKNGNIYVADHRDTIINIEDITVPESYYEQDSCQNCKFVFEKSDWDYAPTYHCLYGAQQPRPPCISSAMEEDRGSISYKIIDRYYRLRYVEPWGICNEFKIITKEYL